MDNVLIHIQYAALTQRGYYPNNPHKSNQDAYTIQNLPNLPVGREMHTLQYLMDMVIRDMIVHNLRKTNYIYIYHRILRS